MKRLRFSVWGAVLLGITSIAHLHGALTLRLSDGTAPGTVTITDQGLDDGNPAPGIVSFSGPVGINWFLNFTAGISKPASGSPAAPYMDIGTLNISSLADGVLTIQLSDTDFVAGGQAIARIGGNTDGTVSFTTWLDPANVLFAESVPITSQGPFLPVSFDGTTTNSFSISGPYSLTAQATISHAFPGKTGFDAEIHITPPACECVLSVVCPSPFVTVQCGADTGTNATGMPVINVSGNCPPVVTTNDVITPGNCAGNYTIKRTWTIEAGCADRQICTQTITVQDTNAPTITGIPADTTVQCDAVPIGPLTLPASDTCDSETISATLNPDVITPGNCAGRYTIKRTWTATDACGNSSTATQIIRVEDTTAPVFSDVPANVTVECSAIPAPATPTASDACGTATVTFLETRQNGSCANKYTLTRTWTATDDCGNSASKSQIITVVDTTAPVLSGVPADVTVECSAIPAPAMPTALDNCGTATVAFLETRQNGSCANKYTLTRTWTATDDCGNSASKSQIITVVDTTAPVLSGVPADVTVECNAVPAPATPTALDKCGAATITYQQTRQNGSCANKYTLTRTWTATDDCGNSVSKSQVITVVDTTAPVLSGVPANTTVECNAIPAPGTPTALDNCGRATITYQQTRQNGSCANKYTLTRTWTATDECGNSASKSQIITVQDTTPPTFTVPTGGDIGCNPLPSNADVKALVTASDNCGQATVTVISVDSGTLCSSNRTFTITVADDCGNAAPPRTVTYTRNCAPCVPSTFSFNTSSGSALDGADGNVRVYTTNGISVKVTAFSRSRTSGAWSTAWLGQYGGGLGVTDNSEGDGSGNQHTVDNDTNRDNYVLFEFSQPVVLKRANLGYVVDDSDLSVWIGTFSDPYNNHLSLNDAVLGSFGFTEDNLTDLTTARWADLNAGEVAGNAIVIAAQVGDTTPEDKFKIALLDICKRECQPLSLTCVSATVGQVGLPYSSSLVASGGQPPYTFSIISGSLPPGLTLNTNTGGIAGTPTTAGAFNFVAKVTDTMGAAATSGAGGCSITITPPPCAGVCVPSTFSFSTTSGSALDGTDGNVRVFSTNGISVKVTAFSRIKASGAWSTAWVGQYNGGLGVTDGSEGDGSGNQHTVDNEGDRDNFVLFEFSQPVVLNRAYLGYVVDDSDLSLAIGTFADPYNNHLTLSDSLFSSFSLVEENLTDLTTSRWADVNAGQVVGNAIVIAALINDTTPEDKFKIALLDVCKPTCQPLALSCVSATSGQVGVPYASSLSASGGTAPYTFAIISGSLSPGLTLNTNTGGITGTPTAAGSFSFVAKVTDSQATTATSGAGGCTITISGPCTASICGSVLRDCDADGLLTGEQGLAGWTVKLKNSGGTVLATTTTDASGNYCFNNLAAGMFTVVVTPMASYTLTAPSACNHQQTVSVTSCQNRAGINFGYTGTSPSVNLVVTGPSSAVCGQTITYTFAVTNTGNTCVYGGMRVDAPLLGGEVFHQTPVSPGEGFVFTKTYLVKAGDPNPLVLTATAIGDPPGGLANVTKQVTVSTAVSCNVAPAPTCLVATPGCNQVSLTWLASSGAASYSIKRSTTKGGPYTTIKTGATSTSYVDTASLVNGTVYYYVVVAVKSGSESGPSNEESAVPSNGLPSPWSTKDIGSVADNGAASYTSPKFTVIGSGADIWNTGDEFRYVYQAASGNCTMVARVASIGNTDPWAKAGVMIRETLTSGSKHASMFVTPGNGVAFQSRTNSADISFNVNTTGMAAPYWVKVIRSGNTFTGYVSANSSTWVTIGSQVIPMTANVYIGLGVTSHNDGALCPATFDNVSVTP